MPITQVDVTEFIVNQSRRLAHAWLELSGENMLDENEDYPLTQGGSNEEEYIQDALASLFLLVNAPKAGDAFIASMLEEGEDVGMDLPSEQLGFDPEELNSGGGEDD